MDRFVPRDDGGFVIGRGASGMDRFVPMDRFVARDDGGFVIGPGVTAMDCLVPMDRFVPRDGGAFVIASEARQSLRHVHELQH